MYYYMYIAISLTVKLYIMKLSQLRINRIELENNLISNNYSSIDLLYNDIESLTLTNEYIKDEIYKNINNN